MAQNVQESYSTTPLIASNERKCTLNRWLKMNQMSIISNLIGWSLALNQEHAKWKVGPDYSTSQSIFNFKALVRSFTKKEKDTREMDITIIDQIDI